MPMASFFVSTYFCFSSRSSIAIKETITSLIWCHRGNLGSVRLYCAASCALSKSPARPNSRASWRSLSYFLTNGAGLSEEVAMAMPVLSCGSCWTSVLIWLCADGERMEQKFEETSVRAFPQLNFEKHLATLVTNGT